MDSSANCVAISVIIPAYNEQWRLPPTLLDCVDFLDGRGVPYEVIVVDDGSVDGTVEVVKKFARMHPGVKVISIGANRGKGNAVRMGMHAAVGNRRIFIDADGSTPFQEIVRLERALDAGAEVAIGSRAVYSTETKIETRWYRKYLGRSFNACVNALILPGVADTQCGFKMFTAPAASFLFRHQTSSGFSFDVEILYLARRAGLSVAEVPINWINIPGSKVNLILDALRMFRDILDFKLKHRSVSPSSFTKESSQITT